jgi:hypothetical protein
VFDPPDGLVGRDAVGLRREAPTTLLPAPPPVALLAQPEQGLVPGSVVLPGAVPDDPAMPQRVDEPFPGERGAPAG